MGGGGHVFVSMDTGSVRGEQTGHRVNRRNKHLETETGGVVCVTGGGCIATRVRFVPFEVNYSAHSRLYSPKILEKHSPPPSQE